jgi:drug/metabolite transporter (DMT)-like permease
MTQIVPYALAAGAAVLWALYPFFLGSIGRDLGGLAVWSRMMMLAGVAGLAVYMLVGPRSDRAMKPGRVARAWWLIGMAALLGPVFGGLMYVSAMSRVERHRVPVVVAIAFTAPVVSAVLGALVFRDTLGRYEAAGTALVCAGVALLTLGERKS